MKPVLMQSQVFIEFQRYPDSKVVYADPVHIVVVEPDDEVAGVSAIRMYSLGGSIRVLGDQSEVMSVIQQSRRMASEITVGALVDIVRDEINGSMTSASKPN